MILVMAQINPLVGDIVGNTALIIAAAQQARDEFAADLVIFPELTLTGYPPEDLLLRPALYQRIEQALQCLSEQLSDIAVLIGYPYQSKQQSCIYNAASLIDNGQLVTTYFKRELPNYGVFDEKRYFTEGKQPVVVNFRGVRIGLTICEDIWFSQPVNELAQSGAQLVINLNASPYRTNKTNDRYAVIQQRVAETGLPIVYVNQVGGQDELVFDGGSFTVNADGELVAQAPVFESGLYPIDLQHADGFILSGSVSKSESEVATLYQALVTGLRDYIEKNGFPGVVLGLSGGIDSALTLALAVDAIGAERVKAVMMPSRYTAQMSLDDAKEMAGSLNVSYSEISIEPSFNAFLGSLSEEFSGLATDITEENIQARCRGILLMAISNKTGSMVLATGNKSEMAVGYSTLYGDMAGGFAPLKDVYKTTVYALSNYRNSIGLVIPERIITRPPSAELAEDQLDQDSLPDYSVLDKILNAYIEEQHSYEKLIEQGFDADMLSRVLRLVDRNEYKRRQAAPGIRISTRAFGRERRYPITSGYSVTTTTKE